MDIDEAATLLFLYGTYEGQPTRDEIVQGGEAAEVAWIRAHRRVTVGPLPGRFDEAIRALVRARRRD